MNLSKVATSGADITGEGALNDSSWAAELMDRYRHLAPNM